MSLQTNLPPIGALASQKIPTLKLPAIANIEAENTIQRTRSSANLAFSSKPYQPAQQGPASTSDREQQQLGLSRYQSSSDIRKAATKEVWTNTTQAKTRAVAAQIKQASTSQTCTSLPPQRWATKFAKKDSSDF